jgi:ammonium transporter, Amt family
VSGGLYRKIGTIQFLIFIFLWTTVVYDPIARWSWHPQGWSRSKLHTLDFAGGTVVHISSGAAVTAIAVYYGIKMFCWEKTAADINVVKNRRAAQMEVWKPQNITYVCLGTVFLWFGWFGFNGGSELSANSRAASACVSTQTAACFGGVTSLILHWTIARWRNHQRGERDDAAQVFCDGVIIALVAITPAAGYVSEHKVSVLNVLFTYCRFQ